MDIQNRRDQMKFAAFLSGDANYHLMGWRIPHAFVDAGWNIQRWLRFAEVLERGKFDMLFIADQISPRGVDDLDEFARTARNFSLEPFTLLAALSQHTSRLGLAATAATTWNEPYTIARMFSSLDHISGGRAAWNLVTGRNPEAALNFSREEHVAHAERYSRAEEFLDVVKGLWDSFEDDAFKPDKTSGHFVDTSKMRLLNHRGPHFSVKGPLSLPRSPQGHPVVIQAGNSDSAKEMAARIAECMFTSQPSFDEAQTFYSDVKARTLKFGRSPDDIKILPGMSVYVGRTHEDAVEKYEQHLALIPDDYAINQLGLMFGKVDLSSYDPNGPVPKVPPNAAVSSPEMWTKLAERENLSLIQLARRVAASKGHAEVLGTPTAVADELEKWFVGGAADGFNLLPNTVPEALDDFVDLVVPELQRRGLFRLEYEGETLRENLGIRRPAIQRDLASEPA